MTRGSWLMGRGIATGRGVLLADAIVLRQRQHDPPVRSSGMMKRPSVCSYLVLVSYILLNS